jgi:hypothetical protein
MIPLAKLRERSSNPFMHFTTGYVTINHSEFAAA